MPRDQRHVPPGTVLEITTRCIGDQFLLVPRPGVREAILGVLGRALFLYPGIEIHAFIFLSNHYHLLLTATDPETLARFQCFLNSNIARKVSKLLGRRGRFWSRRYADIPVVDSDAQLARLRYLFENGCKEGLVASPLDWPGATSAASLVHGTPLFGSWEDTTGLFRARRRGERPDPANFTHVYEVSLHPIPCWRDLPEEERGSHCRQIVADIEASMAGRPVMGVERILAQDPDDAPPHPSHSPEPRCHASTKELWIIHVAAHRDLRDVYRRISARIRRGELVPSAIPPHTLPPPLHWHPDRNVSRLDAYRETHAQA